MGKRSDAVVPQRQCAGIVADEGSRDEELYRSGHNGAHSKCVCRYRGTWVRIPPAPPFVEKAPFSVLFLQKRTLLGIRTGGLDDTTVRCRPTLACRRAVARVRANPTGSANTKKHLLGVLFCVFSGLFFQRIQVASLFRSAHV